MSAKLQEHDLTQLLVIRIDKDDRQEISSQRMLNISDGDGEACGTIDSGTQLYCPDKYHCCDSVIHSCCEDGYVCWKSVCISIIP